MKVMIVRILLVLIGIVFVMPFVVAALIVGYHAAKTTAQNTHDDLLLIALAFSGAVVSIAKGLLYPIGTVRCASLRIGGKNGTVARNAFMDAPSYQTSSNLS